MTNWYEKWNSMTLAEREEFRQKAVRDIANMNEEEHEMFQKLLRDISDSLLAKAVWEEMQAELARRKDEDYELNEPQYSKFLLVSAYFYKLVRKCGGEFTNIPLEPKRCSGYISVKLNSLDLEGDGKAEFFNAISAFVSFGINAMTDGRLLIEGVIPNVFVRKPAGEPGIPD
ncbi:MAG: hypothetical protein LUH18_03745 [Oscillospiraceae bacterium]|nr:hypothetical protein [Oscillospiraceae bacterium]